MAAIPEQVLRWIRGELSSADFEPWVYANTGLLESALGKERMLQLLETDYGSGHAGSTVRYQLARLLTRSCRCLLTCDRQSFGLAGGLCQWLYEKCEQRKAKTPWLKLVRCRECGQDWLTGCDTVDDRIFLERTSAAAALAIVERDEWPATFVGWEHLWHPSTPKVTRQVLPEEFSTGLVSAADFDE
jgi:hypothetical protein